MQKRRSLASKITLFSTGVVLFATVVMAVSVYLIATSYFEKYTIRILHNEAKMTSSDIQSSLVKITDDLTFLSKIPSIQGIMKSAESAAGQDVSGGSSLPEWKDRLSVIFSSMLSVNKNYTQIRFIGVGGNGKEIVRVTQAKGDIFRSHESALQAKGEEDYFKQALQLTQGSIIFSSVTHNQEYGRNDFPLVPTLKAVMPIYNQKQKIFGVLVISINFKRYLRERLIRHGNPYDIIIYNQHDNFFVYDTQTQKIDFYSQGEALPEGLFNNEAVTNTNQIIPFLKNTKESITVLQPIYSNHYKEGQVLTLAISVPREVIFEKDDALINLILLLIIVLSIIVSFSIYVFSNRTMRYLTAMAKSIDKSSRTGEEPILPVHLGDEAGFLARAFEKKTKQLDQLALYDSLTGLPNRKNLLNHLEEAIYRAKRNQSPIAIFFIDLNEFKKVNDTYGHDAGDSLLINFAATLKSSTREVDYCARLSGDEFVVLVEGVGNTSEIDPILSKYARALNKSYVIKGVTLHNTISMGVAFYPKDAETARELLKKADVAMYKSKEEGRGNFHIYNKKMEEDS